jgi:hypothetical protein
MYTLHQMDAGSAGRFATKHAPGGYDGETGQAGGVVTGLDGGFAVCDSHWARIWILTAPIETATIPVPPIHKKASSAV